MPKFFVRQDQVDDGKIVINGQFPNYYNFLDKYL